MKHLKYLKINESLTPSQLAEELKDARWIEPAYISKDHLWGVIYFKNKEKKQEGLFNTPDEAYRFLEDLGVEYKGKEGYAQMSRFREADIKKLPFQRYQKYLLEYGLKDFEI